MSEYHLDTVGLKCHQPILRIAEKAVDLEPGDVLQVTGDCPFFEGEVRTWCDRLHKRIRSIEDLGAKRRRITIQF